MKLRDKRLDIVVSIVRAFSVFFFSITGKRSKASCWMD